MIVIGNTDYADHGTKVFVHRVVTVPVGCHLVYIQIPFEGNSKNLSTSK